MNYSFTEIAEITGGRILHFSEEKTIRQVIFDTRKSSFETRSIFFAFKGAINDGHNYISEAYSKGVRNFVVSSKIAIDSLPDANVLKVNSALQALQKLAAHHRQKYDIPVIAITGSNGKTVVKEWLGKVLSKHFHLVKSPKSYNSQIGVALSILQLEKQHELAIIEAGISKKNEMRYLERMIKPTIGIFTNLGDAHSSGFDSMKEKLDEKLILFRDCDTLICCADQEFVFPSIKKKYNSKIFSWGKSDSNSVQYNFALRKKNLAEFEVLYKSVNIKFNSGFTNDAFIENMMHVISTMLHLDIDPNNIKTAAHEFDILQNRLEIREGINNNLLINDSYSLDMASMQLALEFQDLHAGELPKMLIFSDFEDQNQKAHLYKELNNLLLEKNLDQIWALAIPHEFRNLLDAKNIRFIENTEKLEHALSLEVPESRCILIKAARRFRLESIFQKLSRQVHQTVLETNLSGLDHNINVYRSYLNDETLLMAVIKAEAYGSGSGLIAQYLEKKKIDYLAVAIIDEAVQIRQSGCSLPIMVFNVDPEQTDALWEYNIEPEVYSFELLQALVSMSKSQEENLKIHLKVDTGMNRLGFSTDEIPMLINKLKDQEKLQICSVLSHLSAAENENFDDFTKKQIGEFEEACTLLKDGLNSTFYRHILNTAGIVRFNNYQYEMVRLGLGLYGIDETGLISGKLEKVHSLRARVLQIKSLAPGASTGYNRSGKVSENTRIAIVSIGYADGLMRIAGNGRFKMRIGDVLYPTIGNICMDVCMLDIGMDSEISAGDEVIVFDRQLAIEELAQACQTISYEIISRLAPRVKRTFVYR